MHKSKVLSKFISIGLCSLFANVSFASTLQNWMSTLPGNIKLNQLILPGSHDAGMSETTNCAPFMISSLSQTQNLNLEQQATAGVRYYDIRPDYDKNKLVTYHRTDVAGFGWGCSGQSINSIFNQALSFLSKNPQETLIFKISHTRNASGHIASDIAQRLINMLKEDKYQEYIYKANNLNINLAQLPLQDIRGKIILVFGDNDFYSSYLNPNQGFFPYHDSTIMKNGLSVYDEYSNTDSYLNMRNDQINKLATNGGLEQSFLFLLSWTLTPKGLTSVKTLSEKTNNQLAEQINFIKNQGYPLPNIIYLDFVNTKLTQTIIDLNRK